MNIHSILHHLTNLQCSEQRNNVCSLNFLFLFNYLFFLLNVDTSKNKKNVGNAAKGKDFKKDYNLSSYKIIFQLAIKQDNVVYISNIACETETIDERKFSTSKY